MGKKRVVFLFGAGAEQKPFNLPSGDELKKLTMETPLGLEARTLGKALAKSFTFEKGYSYSGHTLTSLNVNVKDEDDNFKQGVLDAYFHYIINPDESQRKFSVVFNYYWILYFVIICPIMKFLKENDLLSKELEYFIRKNPEELNCNEIIEKIDDFTKALYEVNINDVCSKKDNYFSYIKKKLEACKSKIDCTGIITTNYYKFAETIISDASKVAYPNGQLKLFEFPNLLEVKDFASKKECIEGKHLYFPFIFGQSYVKPIVHKKQIEEFSKVIKILGLSRKSEMPDYLVILGFGVRDDDNHLNSFIHDYMKNGGKLIVVTSEKKQKREEQLQHQLKLSSTESINVIQVNYKKETEKTIVDKIFDKINLE